VLGFVRVSESGNPRHQRDRVRVRLGLGLGIGLGYLKRFEVLRLVLEPPPKL